MDYATLLVPLLTALFVAVITWLQQHRAEQKSRHAERLAQQIQSLYGPLYFFTGHNQRLQQARAAIDGHYTTTFVNVKYSDDERTQKSVDEEATTTIDVMNKYTAKVMANNTRMMRVVTKNYAYIHPDDVEALQEFVTDWNRLKLEKGLPYHVIRKVAPLVFYRQEFVDRIKHRFHSLSEELRSLTEVKPWFWSRLYNREPSAAPSASASTEPIVPDASKLPAVADRQGTDPPK